MKESTWRALLGVAMFFTFFAAGFGMLTEPTLGVISHINQAGINYKLVAYAFMVSGVMNGLDGVNNKPLNPLWFAVFVFYTGFTWIAVSVNPQIPFAPAAFYSLLCVFYTFNYLGEEREEKLKNAYRGH